MKKIEITRSTPGLQIGWAWDDQSEESAPKKPTGCFTKVANAFEKYCRSLHGNPEYKGRTLTAHMWLNGRKILGVCDYLDTLDPDDVFEMMGAALAEPYEDTFHRMYPSRIECHVED